MPLAGSRKWYIWRTSFQLETADLFRDSFFSSDGLSASWAPSVIPFSWATFLPPALRALRLLDWRVVLDEDEVSSGSFKRRGRSLKLEVLCPHLITAMGRTHPFLAALHHPSTQITVQISLIH